MEEKMKVEIETTQETEKSRERQNKRLQAYWQAMTEAKDRKEN